MKCAEVQNNLIFFYYKELPQEHLLRMQEHLDECEACRLEYNKLALILDYAEQESQALPQRDIWEAVGKKIQDSSSVVVRRLTVFEVVAVAASILIAVFLGSWTGRVYVNSIEHQSQNNLEITEYDTFNSFESLDQNIVFVVNE